MEPDLQSVLFLIGVQELGMGYKKFKKDEDRFGRTSLNFWANNPLAS
jgi:hypothetical protein